MAKAKVEKNDEVIQGNMVLDASEVMSVIQLPIIEQKFELLKQQIQTEIDQALALECTEGTVRDVKKARAELNRQFQQNYEEARKDIKSKILAPYNYFEDLYKKNVAEQFKRADGVLAEKIQQVEGELKRRKREEVLAYFAEYKTSLGLDDEECTLDDTGVAINLSSSMRSLKDAVRLYLDNLKSDLVCIAAHENADEIMVEYRKTKSLSQAIYAVDMRHEALARERERIEAMQEEKVKEAEHDSEIQDIVKEDEAFTAPEVHQEAEDDPIVYEVTFRVQGTLEQIIGIKNHLENNNLIWEQIG